MTGNDQNRDEGIDRRTVLKAVGTSAVAGIALSGNASAESVQHGEIERVEAAYDDEVRARWALDAHAQPVLAALAEKGVLERESVTELEFSERTVKGLAKDGQATAQITAEAQTDDGHVEFFVRPETGRAYATVFGEEQTYTLESPAGRDVVTQDDCWYEHRCKANSNCTSLNCVYQERYCCRGLGCGAWQYDGCCAC